MREMPKIDYNGTVREMTAAELEESLTLKVEEVEPSAEERIANLEAMIAKLIAHGDGA